MAAATDVLFSRAQLPVRTTGMRSMASKMWATWIIMGLMVVAAALIVDLVTSSTVADYFSNTKLDREAAVRALVCAPWGCILPVGHHSGCSKDEGW
jgi:hypothetical protein